MKRQSEFVIAVADCQKCHIQKTEIQSFLKVCKWILKAKVL